MTRLIAVFLLVSVACVSFAQTDPYASLSASEKATLKPGIERYIHDQLKQNWADLWEIQDQTSDMKNDLMFGNRIAPDMSKDQFVAAMKEVIATGNSPRMKDFHLQVAKADKGNFIVIGCATWTRESWRGTGFAIFGARIVDGKAKFDIWSMTSNSCTDKM